MYALIVQEYMYNVHFTYRVPAVLTPVFEPNINLHKTFKNNNSLMKLSGIVNLKLDFTFSGSHLAATTSSSLGRKRLQVLLRSSLGMLLKTSMMVVIRDCFFV
jgi:hypothetical protein